VSESVAAAGPTVPAAEPERPSRVPDYLLCAGLALAGVVVLFDALQLSDNRTGTDPLGPKPVPVLVASLLIILAACLAVSVVWGLIASLFIGNTLLLLLNLPLAPIWAKLLRIPRPYLYAGILFFASMGAYAVNGSPFDLILLLALGLLGFVMRRFGLPVLPLIVAVILGPRVELQGRRALQLSSGEWRGLFGSTNPATGQFELSAIAITAYAIILLIMIWPWLFKAIRRVLPAKAAAAVEAVSEEPALSVAEHRHIEVPDAATTSTHPDTKETRE
jgi:putative tricarboxylic transport membrane protein